MKTRFINSRGVGLRAFVGGFALLALLAFVLPQAASANTAANTVIRNTATVNFQDTAGTAMTPVSSTVDITVQFVCAQPILSAPTDITTTADGTAVYNYTVTAAANGPDNYNLSAEVTAQSAGISGSTVSSVVPDNVDLGATVASATAASGTAVITVPNDNNTGTWGGVNGIVAGDTVVIGGNVYTVASISDGGTTVGGTSTITLTTNLSTNVAIGDVIAEQKSFAVTVDPGTIAAGALVDQTITVLTTADGDTGTCAVDTDETITTVQIPKLTITKEVTTTDDCSGGWVSSGGVYPPGDTICYRITVRNTGNGNAQVVTVTDPLPLYTTYVANSTLLNNITVFGDGATLPLIAGLLVDDNGIRAPGVAATGILSPYTSGPAGEAIVIFKVTIN